MVVGPYRCGIAIVLSLTALGDPSTPEYIVEGTVRAGGNPVEQAVVVLECGDERARSVTRKDGRYRLSLPIAGRAQLVAELAPDDHRTLYRLARSVVLASGPPARVDLDLNPGTNSVMGTLTRNNRPVAEASAVFIAQFPDQAEFVAVALSDELGAYRLDGLPSGNHALQLDPRPTVLDLAAARRRKPCKEYLVALEAGQSLCFDYDLAVGDLLVRAEGIGFAETGRLIVVPGEFAGPMITEGAAEFLLRRAVAMRIRSEDGRETIADLPVGVYSVFFTAFDRNAVSVRRALKTARVAYDIVCVGENGASTSLRLK